MMSIWIGSGGLITQISIATAVPHISIFITILDRFVFADSLLTWLRLLILLAAITLFSRERVKKAICILQRPVCILSGVQYWFGSVVRARADIRIIGFFNRGQVVYFSWASPTLR